MPAARGESELELDGRTLQFMQHLWELVHALDVRSKRMVRELGVTGPQRLVLRVLGRVPASSASDIAESIGLHPSTLTGILKRLEHQGFLRREVDPADRRRARLRLTKKGVQLNRRQQGTVEAAITRALARGRRGSVATAIKVFERLSLELNRRD